MTGMLTVLGKATNIRICGRRTHVLSILVCSAICACLYLAIYHEIFASSSRIQAKIDDFFYLQSSIRDVSKSAIRMTGNLKREVEMNGNVTNRNEYSPKCKTKMVKYLLVIFTTFSHNEEKYLCRNNTVQNWMTLGSNVKTVFFSDEPILKEKVRKLGWDVLTPTKTSFGIPILKYMYLDVMQKYNASFYAFANGDILFTWNLIETLNSMLQLDQYSAVPMLIIGQRINVFGVTKEEAATHDTITNISKTRGELFNNWGMDYFITNVQYPWKDCPEVVIGRPIYDNFLLVDARKRGHITIDATQTLLALHQTDKGGNDEGKGRNNADINRILIKSLYKGLNTSKGRTTCASFFTTYDETGAKILLNERKPVAYCFPL